MPDDPRTNRKQILGHKAILNIDDLFFSIPFVKKFSKSLSLLKVVLLVMKTIIPE